MAKRMQDKESIAGMSWLVLLIIACWGGLVRYLIDVKQSKATWSLIKKLSFLKMEATLIMQATTVPDMVASAAPRMLEMLRE